MNRENIEKFANYNLIAEYLSLKKETVKAFFKRSKRSISNPQDVAHYLDKNLLSRGGVYMIENLVSGKKYIGQSVNMFKRRQSHQKTLKGGNHCNLDLQEDYNSIGEQGFIYYPYIFSDKESDRLKIEEGLINNYGYKNVYNMVGRHLIFTAFTKKELEVMMDNLQKMKDFIKSLENEPDTETE